MYMASVTVCKPALMLIWATALEPVRSFLACLSTYMSNKLSTYVFVALAVCVEALACLWHLFCVGCLEYGTEQVMYDLVWVALRWG